ncbi:MAG: hypothetical protein RIS17_1743 [Pseudomonadota bacterium]|jgi:NADH dehydrogenase FAD-containing subunit
MAERTIILAGGGHAHLGVLAAWARQPPPDTRRILITSHRHTAYSGMLPGWMAGLYDDAEILIDLAQLAADAGTELLLADVTGLDPHHVHIGSTRMAFDIASLAVGGVIDTAPFAATGARLLPIRPVERFMAGWRAVLQASGDIAIIGGGAGGFELASAARAALPHIAVTLVTPPGSLLAGHAPAVVTLARRALASRRITLVEASASGHPEGVVLDSGTILPAAAVILATGSIAPPWLSQSGLATTPYGHLAVDATLAVGPHIFAAGDIIQRTDRPLPRSGVHAVKAGPVLAANIAARLSGTALQPYQPPPRTLYLLSTGDRRAILSWGRLAMHNRAMWQLKHAIDAGFMRRQRR